MDIQTDLEIHLIESHRDMLAVQEIQSQVWGQEDVVPIHVLVTAAHNGGLVLGALVKEKMVGFVFGFPGLVDTPEGTQPKHCSHMLAVLPEFRSLGIGYALKRAQWQLVRKQGLTQITWTYDPLLSRNAHLNIVRLGAVCNTYLQNVYGEMRDKLNQGLPSDRFQVDLWVHSSRVADRMSRTPRQKLDLAHYFAAGAEVVNPTQIDETGKVHPPDSPWIPAQISEAAGLPAPPKIPRPALVLLEIPSNFTELKRIDRDLALHWRLHTRALFEKLFSQQYLVTDFIYLPGETPRSFYVLSHGEKTLGD